MSYIVTKPTKSKKIAILLVLLFGSLGLFYASIAGGVIMSFIMPIVFLLIWAFSSSNANSLLLLLFLIFTYYIICFIWAVEAVSNYNRKILASAASINTLPINQPTITIVHPTIADKKNDLLIELEKIKSLYNDKVITETDFIIQRDKIQKKIDILSYNESQAIPAIQSQEAHPVQQFEQAQYLEPVEKRKPSKAIIWFALSIIVVGASVYFGSRKYKENEAITLCQNATAAADENNIDEVLGFKMLGINTWLDYANQIAKKYPNKIFAWQAEKTDESDVYLVEFTDTSNWGYTWQVNLKENVVRYVDDNEYLVRKYGLSQLANNTEFELTDIKIDTLKIISKEDFDILNYTTKSTTQIVYQLKGSILNKTDKIITDATLEGTLKLIFKEKTTEKNQDDNSGFKSDVSEENPWKPNTKKSFSIQTEGMEKSFLNYTPEYVVFDLKLDASDPTGYSFHKDITEYDLKNIWKNYQKQNNTK